MGLFVQKFGGTSLATIECIEHVADVICKTRDAGHQLAVVVSAMAGETDRLIGLAKKITSVPNPREYAALISTGEQVSMALLAMMLNTRGYAARSYTGMQAKILTDPHHTKAQILHIDETQIRQDIKDGRIPVIAGFQGYCLQGDITTLGRGGSDATAVALAAHLAADECQIFTDVDGIFTTDPRLVQDAKRLDAISFEEMLELASLGSKVLQLRAVELASKYNVPVRVLSTFKEGPGTLIADLNKSMEKPIISGVAFSRKEAKVQILGIPDLPHVLHQIVSHLSERKINIGMIVQNRTTLNKADLILTVHRDDYTEVMQILTGVASELQATDLLGDISIAKLSLVGIGISSHHSVASTMFKALAENGIYIHLVSMSELKISVIVDEVHLEPGVKALHEAFNLNHRPLL